MAIFTIERPTVDWDTKAMVMSYAIGFLFRRRPSGRRTDMDPLQTELLHDIDGVLNGPGSWLVLSAKRKAALQARRGFVASMTPEEVARLKTYYVTPESKEKMP